MKKSNQELVQDYIDDHSLMVPSIDDRLTRMQRQIEALFCFHGHPAPEQYTDVISGVAEALHEDLEAIWAALYAGPPEIVKALILPAPVRYKAEAPGKEE